MPALLLVWALLALVLLILACKFAYRMLLPSPRNQAPLDLRGKTILLTGASSGIGREMARVMHAKGARLILASRSVAQLEKLCAELNDSLGQPRGKNQILLHKAHFLQLDIEEITKDDAMLNDFVRSVHSILASICDNHQLDVLVNNAGQMAYGSGRDTRLSVLRRMLDVNYLGHVALSQALLPSIPDHGALVVLSSIVGRVALPYLGAYSAAKHAVQAFFDSLRCEDRPQLQILTVSPGYVNTELGPNALNEKGGVVGTRDPGQVAGMSAEKAAKEIVAALERRETDLLLAPFLPRLLLSLRLATPNLMWFFLHRHFRSLYGTVGKCG